jgi:hypothetical protein
MNTCSVSTEGSGEPVQGGTRWREEGDGGGDDDDANDNNEVRLSSHLLSRYRDGLLSGGEPINKAPSGATNGFSDKLNFFTLYQFLSPQSLGPLHPDI